MRLTIYTDVLKNNVSALADFFSDKEIGFVVKANSYGLGYEHTIPALDCERTRCFFVNSDYEALALEKHTKKPIYLLDGFQSIKLSRFLNSNIIPVIGNFEELGALYNYYFNENFKIKFAIRFNLGMNRVGFKISEIDKLSDTLGKFDFNPSLMIGHLSCNELKQDPRNNIELRDFMKITHAFKDVKASLLSSYGCLLGDDFVKAGDIIRFGAWVYGCGIPKDHPLKSKVKFPAHLEAKIAQTYYINREEEIGYNHTFKAKKDMRVATLLIGSAAGIQDYFFEGGYCMINKYKCPYIGKPSTNYISVDITQIPPSELISTAIIYDIDMTPDMMADKTISGDIGVERLLDLRIPSICISAN